MYLEVVREVVRALNDTDDGVAAQLAALPKDAGQSVDSDLTIVDGTSDDFAAKGEQITRSAEIMLLVTPDGPTVTSERLKGGSRESNGMSFSQGATPVAITVVHRGNRQPAQKVQDAAYVMRACVLTLTAYFAQSEDGRIRNQITLLKAYSVIYGLVADDGLGAIGAVTFTVDALDKRTIRTA